MRPIDADAFIAFIKSTIKKQGYEHLELNEHLTVSDVLEAIISDLDGTCLDGFKNAPTIDAVPVEFIKGRLKDLRKMLMDADKDDVDEIWDLRTKIDTFTELLEMWAERKDHETD